jgi:hypothetical protein
MNRLKGKRVTVLVCTQGLTDKVQAGFSSGSAVASSLMGYEARGASASETNKILDFTSVIPGHDAMYFAMGARPTRNPDNSVSRDASTRINLPASSSGKSNDKQLTFVQYNALLETTDNLGVVVAEDAQHCNSVIWWNDDHYVFSGGYRANADAKTMFDMIWANTTKTGTTEVIPSAARFNANLLKDENGVILGVVFQQIAM